MNKENQSRLIIVICACLLIGWGLYAFFYQPKLAEISQSKKSLSLLENEISTLLPDQRILKRGELENSLKTEVLAVEEKLPSRENLGSVIQKIISQEGIDYVAVEPQNLVDEKNYKRLPLKLRFGCSFYDLDAFLQRLENLPLILRVDKLDTYKNEKSGEVEVSLIVSIFLTAPSEKTAENVVYKKHKYVRSPFDLETLNVTVESSETLPELNGIWYGVIPKAIINNQVTSVGKYVAGWRVSSISSQEVILTKKGRKYTLRATGGK